MKFLDTYQANLTTPIIYLDEDYKNKLKTPYSSSPIEIGTNLYIKEYTPTVNYKLTIEPPYYGNMIYGYMTSNGEKIYEDRKEMKISPYEITSHDLRIKQTGTTKTEIASVSGKNLNNLKLENVYLGATNRTPQTIIGVSQFTDYEFECYQEEGSIYALSNWGNSSSEELKLNKFFEGDDGLIATGAGTNQEYAIYTYPKFFIGESDEIDPNNFNSEKVRNLKYSAFAGYNNAEMSASGGNSSSPMIAYSNRAKITVNTTKSIAIALPVESNDNEVTINSYTLSAVKDENGDDVTKLFFRTTNPIDVYCGDEGLKIKYHVYLWPNSTGANASAGTIYYKKE
jgi:hypothetical protein